MDREPSPGAMKLRDSALAYEVGSKSGIVCVDVLDVGTASSAGDGLCVARVQDVVW